MNISNYLSRIIFSITVVIFSIFILLYILGSSLLFFLEEKESKQVLAQIIAANSVSAVTFEDTDSLQDTLDSISSDRRVLGVAIYRLDGQLLYFSGRSNKEAVMVPLKDAFKSEFEQSRSVFSYIDSFAPIKFKGGQLIGSVQVRSSIAHMFSNMVFSLFLLIIAIILSYVFSRRFVKSSVRRMSAPIADLNTAITETTISVLENKIPTFEVHQVEIVEIQQLSENFDSLLSQLRKKQSKIISYQQHLEQKINARTVDLMEATHRAKQANKAKSAFLANISHEIRTPINGIIGVFRILEGKPLDDDIKHYVHIAQVAVEQLFGLLNDVLDFSKIEKNGVSIQLEKFDLHILVSNTIQIYMATAEHKNIDVIFQPFNLPQTVFGDPTCYRQIISNLVSNAIKFTESGTIVVSGNSDQNMIHLVVEDSGIGMSKEQMGNIFHPFMQAHHGITKAYGGTGLGLAIVKKIVEANGGTITVNSSLGQGSRFEVVLPILTRPMLEDNLNNDQQEFDGLSIDADSLSLDYSGMKVLLVEDNELNRLVTISLFADHGVFVSEAHDGQQAVEMVENDSFDLILMDVQMPVMNGLDATRLIRAREEIKNAKRSFIVAMTANVTEEVIGQAKEVGADDYIAKPYRVEDLFGIMKKCKD